MRQKCGPGHTLIVCVSIGMSIATMSAFASKIHSVLPPTPKNIPVQHLNVDEMVNSLRAVTWETTSSIRGDKNHIYSTSISPDERNILVTRFKKAFRKYGAIARNISAEPSLIAFPLPHVFEDMASIQQAYEYARHSEHGSAFMRAVHRLYDARRAVYSLRTRLDFQRKDDPELNQIVDIYNGIRSALSQIPMGDIDHLVGPIGNRQIEEVQLKIGQLAASPLAGEAEIDRILGYALTMENFVSDRDLYLGDISKHLVDKLSSIVGIAEKNKLYKLAKVANADVNLTKTHEDLDQIEAEILTDKNMTSLASWYRNLNRGLPSTGIPQNDLPPLFERIRNVLGISLDDGLNRRPRHNTN